MPVGFKDKSQAQAVPANAFAVAMIGPADALYIIIG